MLRSTTRSTFNVISSRAARFGPSGPRRRKPGSRRPLRREPELPQAILRLRPRSRDSAPPTLIVSGTADPLIDDNSAFAAKLKAAGNAQVEHFVRERMPHGYYFFPHLLKEGDEAFSAAAAFLQRSLKAAPGAST